MNEDEKGHIATAHKTSMTQSQRKEIVLVLTMNIGDSAAHALQEVAEMNDRQLHLSWLRVCAYISEETYRREMAACVGIPFELVRK